MEGDAQAQPGQPLIVSAMAVKIVAVASFILGGLALDPGARVVLRIAWLYVVTGARG